MLTNQFHHVPYQQAHSYYTEQRKEQLSKPFDTKSHAVVFDKTNLPPGKHLNSLSQAEIQLNIDFQGLIKQHYQQDNTCQQPAFLCVCHLLTHRIPKLFLMSFTRSSSSHENSFTFFVKGFPLPSTKVFTTTCGVRPTCP